MAHNYAYKMNLVETRGFCKIYNLDVYFKCNCQVPYARFIKTAPII